MKDLFSFLLLPTGALKVLLLPLLLLAALAAGGGARSNSRLPIVLYALCLFTAVGLGYIGGEIGYG